MLKTTLPPALIALVSFFLASRPQNKSIGSLKIIAANNKISRALHTGVVMAAMESFPAWASQHSASCTRHLAANALSAVHL